MGENPKTRVTILSRPGCHLCNVLARLAQRLADDLPIEVAKVNVDEDPGLRSRYGDRVPVVLVEDLEACAGKVTEPELRRAIERTRKSARWRRPISRILSRLGLQPSRG